MTDKNPRMVITGVKVAAQCIHFPRDDSDLGNGYAMGPRPRGVRL